MPSELYLPEIAQDMTSSVYTTPKLNELSGLESSKPIRREW